LNDVRTSLFTSHTSLTRYLYIMTLAFSNLMRRTTLYVYDDKIYQRMQAVAKIQGKSVLKFIWDELINTMERNYSEGTLAQYIYNGKIPNPPNVKDSIDNQRAKFVTMSLDSLKDYEKDLLRHIKIFKNELRGKKNE